MICDVHIGFYNTGTTTLQSLLRAHRDRLRQVLGAGLVDRDDAESLGLRRACIAFAKAQDEAAGKRVADEMRKLLERTKDNRLLLSLNILCGPIPTPARKGPVLGVAADCIGWAIKGAEGHVVRLYACTRDEKGWLSSLYRHNLRVRGIRLTEAQFRDLPAFSAFRFADLLAEIRARTGQEVTVWRMEDDLGTRLGSGTGLLRALGLSEEELDHWTQVPARNEGLSPRAVGILTGPTTMRLPVLARRVLARLVTIVLPDSRARVS